MSNNLSMAVENENFKYWRNLKALQKCKQLNIATV